MVTITTIDDSNYVAPTDAELKRLKAIVFAKHHDIEAAVTAARITDFDQQFRRAFAAIGNMYRLSAPSKKHYFSFYVDSANDWLVRHGHPASLVRRSSPPSMVTPIFVGALRIIPAACWSLAWISTPAQSAATPGGSYLKVPAH